MLFLFLSIICSVSVGVVFKIIRQQESNIPQIIMFNYLVAFGLCYFIFKPDFFAIDSGAPWGIYFSSGILLPSVFLFLVSSIQYVGIVKTDVSQRLSLFLSLIAAVFVFKESFGVSKIIALLIGFFSLGLLLYKKTEEKSNKWIFPFLVFVGFGVIDILFKQIATHTALLYTTSLFVVFGIALFITFLYVGFFFIFKKKVLSRRDVILGCIVGVLNFGNILMYLKAHQVFVDSPSTVFAGMNLGVVVLGSVVGILIFKEKQSKLNILGVVLALVSIVLLVVAK